MTTDVQQLESPTQKRGFRGVHVLWFILVTILVTAAVTFWLARTYIYAKDFEPVELNIKEQQVLNTKLRSLGYESEPVDSQSKNKPPKETDEVWLRSKRYSEVGAKREVSFSERELNAILAKNKDLAKKLAVDLGDDLVSARLLVPVDQDFPILGGKTLRVSAGVEMAFRNAKPVIMLKGVSVMGVPIPNAWLGGLKNIDIIREYGDKNGFWKGFSGGIENMRVEEGFLKIKLKK